MNTLKETNSDPADKFLNTNKLCVLYFCNNLDILFPEMVEKEEPNIVNKS